MPDPAPPTGASVASRVGIAALAVAAAGLCAWLGLWQWDRAHVRAEAIAVEPAVELSELIAVSDAPGAAVGRAAWVDGAWQDGRVLVPGRAVDGVDATLLLAEFRTGGSGQPGTLAVIVGWAPSADLPPLPSLDGVDAQGWLRASEAPAPIDREATPPTSTAASSAAVAQLWPAPTFSPLLVLGDGAGQWRPLPQPEPQSRLNFQSLTYAAEWWVFGLFALVVGARWVRDNGRTEPTRGNP